jgi:hypothetical protein
MKRAAHEDQILAFVSQELMAGFGKGLDISIPGHMRQSCRAFPILNAMRTELRSLDGLPNG